MAQRKKPLAVPNWSGDSTIRMEAEEENRRKVPCRNINRWPKFAGRVCNKFEQASSWLHGKQLKLDEWLPHTDAKSDEPAILALEDVEHHHTLKVLEQTGCRISGARGAAKMLNIKASTLRSRMEKLGMRK